MIEDRSPTNRLILVALFGASFAFVESSVVVYLRSLYYPGGFRFPLKMIEPDHLVIEMFREVATLIMLAAVALIAGKRRWERFGFFLLAFGIWDIFYYIWLKIVIDWPLTLFDWDILFLLPVPWIGPVLAPLLVALTMCAFGIMIVVRLSRNLPFEPGLLSWILAIAGTILILYSFVADFSSTIDRAMPMPYDYRMLVIGLLLYAVAFRIVWTRSVEGKSR